MNNRNLHIDQLIEKYWAGDASLAEESELRNYFSLSDVRKEHQDLQVYFAGLHSQPAISMSTAYSKSFWLEKATKIPKETKIRAFRQWTVAASFLLICGLGLFYLSRSNDHSQESTVASAEEAIEETEKALLFLAEHFKKGQEASLDIRHIKTLGKTLN